MDSTTKIKLIDHILVLSFNDDDIGEEDSWLNYLIQKNETIRLKGFSFSINDIYYFDKDDNTIYFMLGEVNNNLVYLNKSLFNLNYEFCFSLNFPFDLKYFSYTAAGLRGRRISIIDKISATVARNIVVSDDESLENAIPINKFIDLVNNFPLKYELELYARRRIEEEIGVYFDSDRYNIEKHERYLNQKYKGNIKDHPLIKYEVEKYEILQQQLEALLKKPATSEKEWQQWIIQIILLIFPNYVHSISNMKVTTEEGDKYIDLCLVTANGYIDIIEIKKPFTAGIISEGKYRSNHYPLRELSGALMQVEKYLYYLKRGGFSLEKALNDRYKDELKGLTLKIGNPKALIIAGSSNLLNSDQISDLELIRKRHANISDIITYEDLLNRLKNIIRFLKGDNNH